MRPVEVSECFPGTVAEAERCWYDAAGWPRWVEGCERIISLDRGWPRAGAVVGWESGPAGRGRVRERVLAHEPLRGMTAEVVDDSIRGRQTVAFVPDGDQVRVELALTYRLERRSLLSPLIDLLFIRRAMAASLASTLHRFGVELRVARREP
ncbi:MAG TPA: SRPBCC family protein [Solirubrobacteraceae bacterium]